MSLSLSNVAVLVSVRHREVGVKKSQISRPEESKLDRNMNAELYPYHCF